ncbi:MAG: putative 2-dehydropantoate 2-reductase [Deltaproteobacteria bacterium]|nr:putative 2-dehydropantoate 2-reductase [Deltaproteobacteria bacterium]
MSTISYAVIGTGALGGYYGAMLRRSGKDVHFLVKSDYEHVLQNGISIESVNGNFSVNGENVYNNVSHMPKCDVVLVALKTTHNSVLSRILPHVIKDSGTVIVMQNGLGVEDEVAAIVGEHRVMGALCFICAEKIAPGTIRHMDYGHFMLGQFCRNSDGAGITAAVRRIADDFICAGVTVKPETNLGLARWKKLVWNIPFNGLSVALNASTKALMNSSVTASLAKTIMEEVVGGANACGFNLERTFVDEMLAATSAMTDYRPSMKVDFEQGRELETEYIFKNPLDAASASGYPMPSVAMLYKELLFLNERNSRM